jgi:hypothetical protein
MKDFKDYRATLTSEKISSIAEHGSVLCTAIQKGQDREDPTYTGNQIAAIAFGEALALLEDYHEWLHQ